MSGLVKVWQLLAHDRRAIDELAAALRLSPIIAQVLINRGIRDPDEARRFLRTSWDDFYRPDRLHGAVEAAERLHRAVTEQRPICVYGDYDTDGITGTALMLQVLRLLGARPEYYVPHRLDEGYGLNVEALRNLARDGIRTVVTVDCGITALAEAEEARRLGLELIITDHHELAEQLPAADVVVHPRHPAGSYPFAGLSGAGVAFKVAWALCQKHCGSERVEPRYREFLLDAVGLAALGLIADVVPLQGENRIFVRHGLARLQKHPSAGLRALITAAGLDGKATLAADDVAYKLAPRLNAVGRLGAARLVVDLLTTPLADHAAELARYLEGQNQKRQQLERRILAEAKEMLNGQDLEQLSAIVLASPDWHPGVIGIVAGRLVETYARPVMLFGQVRSKENLFAMEGTGEATAQGSGRSIPDFPLNEALCQCHDLLLSHGGHAAAAGCRIQFPHIDAFRDRFTEVTRRFFPGGTPEPKLVIDAEVPLAALTHQFVRDLDRLEPYGSANRRPLFLAGGLQIVGEPAKVGGGDRHVSFRIKQQGTILRAIGFNLADRFEELMSQAGQCCLVFTPRINEWNGYSRIDLEVIDFQPGLRAKLKLG